LRTRFSSVGLDPERKYIGRGGTFFSVVGLSPSRPEWKKRKKLRKFMIDELYEPEHPFKGFKVFIRNIWGFLFKKFYSVK
jgi:hypothetical protein